MRDVPDTLEGTTETGVAGAFLTIYMVRGPLVIRSTKTPPSGNRFRVVWAHGDGDGAEPNDQLLERTLTTVTGHPTWKLFRGDVFLPLSRGSSEPPRYVYLDDQACFSIWISKLYSKDELKKYWPFDFDRRVVRDEKDRHWYPSHSTHPDPFRGGHHTYRLGC